MKLIDTNLLIYATDASSPHFAASKAWLDRILSSEETVALPWVVLLGFIRITTNARAFNVALTTAQALDVVSGWLAQPQVVTLEAEARHWEILRDLMSRAGVGGDLTTDAHLAALAIANDAELCSADMNFGRFRGLRWTNPLL